MHPYFSCPPTIGPGPTPLQGPRSPLQPKTKQALPHLRGRPHLDPGQDNHQDKDVPGLLPRAPKDSVLCGGNGQATGPVAAQAPSLRGTSTCLQTQRDLGGTALLIFLGLL